MLKTIQIHKKKKKKTDQTSIEAADTGGSEPGLKLNRRVLKCCLTLEFLAKAWNDFSTEVQYQNSLKD